MSSDLGLVPLFIATFWLVGYWLPTTAARQVPGADRENFFIIIAYFIWYGGWAVVAISEAISSSSREAVIGVYMAMAFCGSILGVPLVTAILVATLSLFGILSASAKSERPGRAGPTERH